MAAPAYHRQYAAAPAVAPRRARRDSGRANVRVVPGSRPASTPKTPSNAAFVAAVVAIVLVLFTLLSFARVAISSATIAASMEAQEVSSQLEAARTEGNKLEVSESVLSNSTNIKEKATKLGMAAPAYVDTLTVERDVVATNSQGDLSLTESIRRASAAVQG